MVKSEYIPNKGDIVWIDLNPTKGHEQEKTRPALVISPKTYNKKTNLALMCPITAVVKEYPFEVVVKTKDRKVNGVVLSDHIRSLDWTARKAQFITKISPKTLQEVQNKLLVLIMN